MLISATVTKFIKLTYQIMETLKAEINHHNTKQFLLYSNLRIKLMQAVAGMLTQASKVK